MGARIAPRARAWFLVLVLLLIFLLARFVPLCGHIYHHSMVVGEFTQEADVLVMGGGPAGYSAAFRAAELGLNVTLVDNRPALGGVCLHEGCIPSKSLLGVTTTIADATRAAAFGVSFGTPAIDLATLRKRCGEVIASLSRGLDALAKQHKVERLQGQAVFENSKHVAIHGGSVPRVKFRKAIVATGSSPAAHPKLPFDSRRVLTAREFMRLFAGAHDALQAELPAALTVIGDGYQAVEIASIAAGLGIRTTLRTEHDTLLPHADADLVRPLVRRLKETIDIRLKDAVNAEALANEPCIVVAIGDRPNTRELGLEHTRVSLDEKGGVVVDEAMRTSDPRILAAGDVTGGAMLADRAIAHGRVAAEVVAGWNSALDVRAVPFAVFTDPQVAWCGLSEEQAKREAIDVRIVKIPWGASGRAASLGRTDGLTKLIVDSATGLVLGAGIVGAQACELIGEACLAIEMGATVTDLAATLHPHPSVSELLVSAAQQADHDAAAART